MYEREAPMAINIDGEPYALVSGELKSLEDDPVFQKAKKSVLLLHPPDEVPVVNEVESTVGADIFSDITAEQVQAPIAVADPVETAKESTVSAAARVEPRVSQAPPAHARDAFRAAGLSSAEQRTAAALDASVGVSASGEAAQVSSTSGKVGAPVLPQEKKSAAQESVSPVEKKQEKDKPQSLEIQGPLEEIRGIDLSWLRIGDLEAATQRIMTKVKVAGGGDAQRMAQAKQAWTNSELSKEYLRVGELAMAKAQPIPTLLHDPASGARLTFAEFQALTQLNRLISAL
jgi:hypothetical protein